MLRKLFAAKVNHALADPKELRRVLAGLPADNAFKSLDALAGWLESLQGCKDYPLDALFDVVRQLDEAAQPHLRHLARDYLNSPRLSKTEEKRLWTIVHGFWSLLAGIYEQILQQAARLGAQDKALAILPLLTVRLLLALGAMLKWQQFRYGPIPGEIWLRLGRAYLSAEVSGFSSRTLQLYPNQPGMTSPSQEYLKALVFHASALDCLLPQEIEIAERLIGHLLPGFLFTTASRPDSVYWVDPAKPMPPVRLAQLPEDLSSTLRFFQPGAAQESLLALIRRIENGGEMLIEFNLGAQYPTELVLAVMRHLAGNWAPIPPQRAHRRYRVKHRLAVLPGFSSAQQVFQPAIPHQPAGSRAESWVVSNVSRGGLGARIPEIQGDWLKVGALIAGQPEGGENWLLALVRRLQRESEQEARVGIMVIGRQVASVELRRETASSVAAATGVPALLIFDGNEADELRAVLPKGSYDPKERLYLHRDGRHSELTPLARLGGGSDYELVKFRETPVL
ncbi:MAG: hypothetical protein RIR00_1245 [Pseudomonadota bacterium]|jgi:hypothetical protein